MKQPPQVRLHLFCQACAACAFGLPHQTKLWPPTFTNPPGQCSNAALCTCPTCCRTNNSLPCSPTTVHFGSNSHELVCRLLSCCLEWRAARGSSGDSTGSNGSVGSVSSNQPLRLLCSDTEFYSATRQFNRLMGEVGRGAAAGGCKRQAPCGGACSA